MSLLDRLGLDQLRRTRPGMLRAAYGGDEAHLREWTRAHRGVEAFVEPRTTVTDTTMLLVDADGAWTRRRIAGPGAAAQAPVSAAPC